MIPLIISNRASRFLFAAALLACACFAHSQVTVAIAPDPHPQFLTSTGAPLANGFVYTYAAGTTTLLNTYVDASGTVQNPNPIPLDVTGAPSNGSVQTGIWLASTAYKICAYNSALVQQWCADNITGYLGLLNLANLWTFQQTFSLPIIDTSTDNQMVFGAAGNQTTLDFPPPVGNITLHFPNINDTVIGTSEAATVANKTLLAPLFNSSGCPISNGPATYICIANANPTGTTLNSPVKFVNAPSQATVTIGADISGVVGVCVSACGNTGNAVIEQSGTVSLAFDGATTAGDYVEIGNTGIGHDAGASYPSSGQILGRVLSTNGGAGTYTALLFGPEIQSGCNLVASNCASDLIGQAGGASLGFTVITGQTYRVGCYVIVTQAATSSSTMPSCVITWVDKDSAVAQSFTLTSTNTGNALTTIQQGFMLVNAKASTNIAATMTGYVSSGATPMQYSVHLRAFPN